MSYASKMPPTRTSAPHLLRLLTVAASSAFTPPSPPLATGGAGGRRLLSAAVRRRGISTTTAPVRRYAAPPLPPFLGPPAYCARCGAPAVLRIPPGADADERERAVCTDGACGHVMYENPKVVVGAVCTHRERVLLCRRAIEPCRGLWGYPQGFMEMGENTREGAARETMEEAGAAFDPSDADEVDLLAVYNLGGSQVQMIYRVELEDDALRAGEESLEVGWFGWEDIPWEELAFPTVGWSLRHAIGGGGKGDVLERTKTVDADGNWTVRKG